MNRVPAEVEKSTRSVVVGNRKNLYVPGFLASSTWAGIKKGGQKDLALIYLKNPATTAGVFTTNRVKGAPVILDRKRIKNGLCQAILINSGNANACTGETGLANAISCARMVANGLKIPEHLVLVSSTGVIGRPLEVHLIEEAIPTLIKNLSPEGLFGVAEAIVTTDKFPKTIQRRGKIGDSEFTVLGIAKGAGMIMPNLATMLAFVLTDVSIGLGALGKVLKNAVDRSFHKITVDGDTSTNDMVLILANGLAGNGIMGENSRNLAKFEQTVTDVLLDLAKMIVKDGEGATKFITLRIYGARSKSEARKVGFTIANSSLVKTALFGGDGNWGRIMAAIGRSGVLVDPSTIDISFDHIRVVKGGIGVDPRQGESVHQILKGGTFTININLNKGTWEETLFTCDLTPEYVRINAAYNT